MFVACATGEGIRRCQLPIVVRRILCDSRGKLNHSAVRWVVTLHKFAPAPGRFVTQGESGEENDCVDCKKELGEAASRGKQACLCRSGFACVHTPKELAKSGDE